MNKEKELIDKLIDLAFAEDIGDGDHTTLSCIPATAMGKSKLLIKEAGVLAGIEVAKEIFNRFDPTMKVPISSSQRTDNETRFVPFSLMVHVKSADFILRKEFLHHSCCFLLVNACRATLEHQIYLVPHILT